MVILKFEKPSTWSFGQKAGALAVILLFLGPFLPFWRREYLNGETASVVYADITTFGLLFLLPIVSALLIILLLFLKFNLYIIDEIEHKKINHFILMSWGFVFFLIYIADVIRVVRYSTSYYSQLAGIGLWFIVLGFLLCIFAGFLEWQKPYMIGPQILIKRKAIANAAVSDAGYDRSSPETLLVTDNMLMSSPVEVSPTVNNPFYKGEGSTIIEHRPNNDEETILLRWLEHKGNNGKTFEQCLKCKNYSIIYTKDTGASTDFTCSECGETFHLKK
jgi:hypothetical protein